MAGLSGLDSWSSAFTARYGAFIQPLPSSSIYVSAQTYADLAAELPVWVKFVPHDGNDFRGWEPGIPECSMDDLRTQYRFPIQSTLEHGQTADVSGRAFCIGSEYPWHERLDYDGGVDRSVMPIHTNAEIEPGTMWFFTSKGMHKVTNVDSGWDRVLEAFDV